MTRVIQAAPVGDLEELWARTPLCEASIGPAYATCGHPACVRVRVVCTACSWPSTLFLCASCVKELGRGNVFCGPLGCGSRDFSWTAW